MRKALAEEFSDIYVFNLRGNQRTAGEQSRKEGGKVFGAGSRATIVIACSSRTRMPTEPARSTTATSATTSRASRSWLPSRSSAARADVPWDDLVPNDDGDWINQRSDEFEAFTPTGGKTERRASAASVRHLLRRARDQSRCLGLQLLATSVSRTSRAWSSSSIDGARSLQRTQRRREVDFDPRQRLAVISWNASLIRVSTRIARRVRSDS